MNPDQIEEQTIEPEVQPEAQPEAVEQPEIEAQPEVSEQADTPSESEEEARLLGWKSPDEWKGDFPPGYIGDPDEFLERLERSKPFRIMKERLEATSAEAEKKLRGIEAAVQAGRKREQERMKADYDRQIAEIVSQQRVAASEGDVERYDTLEKDRQAIKPPEPEVQPEQPQGDPLTGFYESNDWLNDPIMRNAGAAAVEDAMQRGQMNRQAPVEQQVAYAEQAVKRHFPHAFPKEAKPKPVQKVDGGGLGAARKQSGFDTLPKDAKDAFQRQVDGGIFENTKEDKDFYYAEYTNAGS